MTSIQMQYWQLQEQKRANRANEAIKAREASAAELNAESRKRETDFREKESNQERYMKQIDYLFDIPGKLVGIAKGISGFGSAINSFTNLFA